MLRNVKPGYVWEGGAGWDSCGHSPPEPETHLQRGRVGRHAHKHSAWQIWIQTNNNTCAGCTRTLVTAIISAHIGLIMSIFPRPGDLSSPRPPVSLLSASQRDPDTRTTLTTQMLWRRSNVPSDPRPLVSDLCDDCVVKMWIPDKSFQKISNVSMFLTSC